MKRKPKMKPTLVDVDKITIPIIVPEDFVPSKTYKEDAAFDIYANEGKIVPSQGCTIVKTGLRMAIPKGYFGQLFPRSGYGLVGIQCHPGIIDSGYRGEVSPIVYNHTTRAIKVNKGDRIAQILIQKVNQVQMYATDFLPGSKRGTKGFGSSDKKKKGKEVRYVIKATSKTINKKETK